MPDDSAIVFAGFLTFVAVFGTIKLIRERRRMKRMEIDKWQ